MHDDTTRITITLDDTTRITIALDGRCALDEVVLWDAERETWETIHNKRQTATEKSDAAHLCAVATARMVST